MAVLAWPASARAGAGTGPPGRALLDVIQAAIPVLAGLAIILSALSALHRENRHLAFYGATLGGGALLFLYLWWLAMLIVACVLLVTVIQNIGGFFGGFGDWFG